jgi:phosphotransferase system HPr (HPr) family protein
LSDPDLSLFIQKASEDFIPSEDRIYREDSNKGWAALLEEVQRQKSTTYLKYQDNTLNLKEASVQRVPAFRFNDILKVETIGPTSSMDIKAIMKILHSFDFLWDTVTGTHKEAAEATVINATGLHMRPFLSIVDLANRFESIIIFRKDGNIATAKRIMAVSLFSGSQGTRFSVEAIGPDASEAVMAQIRLVGSNFEEF